MYEAYQHIIKVQVEYLIKLGVNPALKVSQSFLSGQLPLFFTMGCVVLEYIHTCTPPMVKGALSRILTDF